MDIEKSRFNMVEQQIRPWDVLDQQVLELLFKVKREDFVPDAYQALAFVDMEIPLAQGAKMWPPRVEARVLQSLQIQRHERVLEVGTGSGYFTALLATQAAAVVTVEIQSDLKMAAEQKFQAHGLSRVQTRLGDAAQDWNDDGLFDVIVFTGSTPVLPEAYLKRLNPGGRFIAFVGDAPMMSARLVKCISSGTYESEDLFESVCDPLVNAQQPDRFEF